MSNVATMSASPVDVKMGGKSYRMSPLTERAIGEVDQWLKARVFRMARENMTPDMPEADRKLLWESAVTLAAGLTWMSPRGAAMMGSFDGTAFIMYLGLRPNHPELTIEDVRTLLLNNANAAEAVAGFDQVNGVPSANSADASKKNVTAAE